MWKMPKWMNAIEVVDHPFTGFWEQRAWVKEAIVKTMSRIDTPHDGQDVGRTVTIAGVAYAGDRGIARVDVSTDEGSTWRPASLESALSAFSWRRWQYRFTSTGSGDVQVLVRAVDGTGAVQTGKVAPPEYSGSTGYHEVTIVEG